MVTPAPPPPPYVTVTHAPPPYVTVTLPLPRKINGSHHAASHSHLSKITIFNNLFTLN